MSEPVYVMTLAPEPGFEGCIGLRFERIHSFRRTFVMLYRGEKGHTLKLTLPHADAYCFAPVEEKT